MHGSEHTFVWPGWRRPSSAGRTGTGRRARAGDGRTPVTWRGAPGGTTTGGRSTATDPPRARDRRSAVGRERAARPRRRRSSPGSKLLVEDAIVDGDQPVRRGGARAAFAYPTFRRVYLGALLSNIGSWMQTVILGAFLYHQTGSATYVALGTLAQLGPLLLLSIPGGAIADRFDRRTVLVVVSVEQLAFSLAIAALVARPPRTSRSCSAASWPSASARRSTPPPIRPSSRRSSTARTWRGRSPSTRPT